MKNVISRTAQASALISLAWIGSAQTAIAARAAQGDLVTAYLAIHNNLAGDSAKDVAASAGALAGAARDLAEQGTHSEELRAIADAADRMKGTELEVLRSTFKSVSRAIADYAEKAGLGLELYYCPMKDAYWLQRGEETRNPYYGESMLTCGQKAETVKKH